MADTRTPDSKAKQKVVTQQRQLRINSTQIRIQRRSQPVSHPNPRVIRRVTDPPHLEQPGNRPSRALWDMGGLLSRRTEPKRLEISGIMEDSVAR